jgi:hypothetical protein
MMMIVPSSRLSPAVGMTMLTDRWFRNSTDSGARAPFIGPGAQAGCAQITISRLVGLRNYVGDQFSKGIPPVQNVDTARSNETILSPESRAGQRWLTSLPLTGSHAGRFGYNSKLNGGTWSTVQIQ